MRFYPLYIHELLTKNGRSIDDYFIIEDTIMYLSDTDGENSFMTFTTWDELMSACLEYLRLKGVRRFASWHAFEKWFSRPLDGEELFLKAYVLAEKGRLKEAFVQYRKAAELGDVGSQLHLGNCYADGIGTRKDIKKGIYWYKKALLSGDTSACSNIALTYKNIGKYRRAEFWWKKAVAKNDGDAALDLAYFYMSGKIKKDRATIIALLNKVLSVTYVSEDAKKEATIICKSQPLAGQSAPLRSP